MNKGKLNLFATSLWIVVVLIFSAFVRNSPTKIYPKTIGNTATIILIDGLSNNIFKNLLAENKLPYFSKLIDRSIYVENGISSFPSMTGYGYYPFVTGEKSTDSGVLGLRWFDRSRNKGNLRNYVGKSNVHMNKDVNPEIKTFFELSKPYYSCSINSFMDKGVENQVITGWYHSTAKYQGKSVFKILEKMPFLGKKLTKDHFEHETYVQEIALRQLEKNPKLQWITFPSPDAYNHIHGTDTIYEELIIHLDSLVGNIIEKSVELGQAEQRLFAIVSDHGVSDVYKNIDIIREMNEKTSLSIYRGKSVNIKSGALDLPINKLDKYEGVFVINGNLCGYLYLRDPSKPENEQWRENLNSQTLRKYPIKDKKINVPNSLAEIEGIDLVVFRDNDTVHIKRSEEEAIIFSEKDHMIYVRKTGDPLELGQDYRLTQEEWLDKNYNGTYPFGVPRVYELMMTKGMGDILFTSQKGYDLASDYEIIVSNYKGGHGGLSKEVLNVPFILHYPDERCETVQAKTSEQVGEMIKKHLGF